jgi:hypothetical protein
MIRTVVAVCVGLALAGCLATPTHHCATATDCGADEQCVALAVDDQRCARVSEFCDSGLAWTEDAGDVAGACVDGAAPAPWNPCLVQAAVTETDTCATEVCTEDPRCCTREWSDTCVNLADRLCALSCGRVGAFVGVDETWVGAWNGVEYQPFWVDDSLAGHTVLSVAFGDYDFDLLPDLATCEDGVASDAAIRIYHNDGDGDFTLDRALPSQLPCWDLDFVDADGDGGVDVVATGNGEIDWVRNDHGLWADPAQIAATGFLVDSDWADVDGDGRMDVAVARYESNLSVLRNEGATFTTWYDSPDAASFPRYKSMCWGEVDRVGGLDLLIGGENFLRLVPNTDSNEFAAGTPFLDRADDDTPTALLVDVDEDTDLDVLAFALSGPLRVFRNDVEGGGSGFTQTPRWVSPAALFPDTVGEGRMEVGDATSDGHLDLVACATGASCQLWVGAGDGTFTEAWAPGDARAIYDVALTSDWR